LALQRSMPLSLSLDASISFFFKIHSSSMI
jgi:hypothetical protein